jgi:hypothetical protein
MDPWVFAEEWLGIPKTNFTPDQVAIVDAIRDNSRVAVTSGNGTGKSWLAAFLALWFGYCHYGSKVIVTSAVFSQVENGIFPEMRKMHALAKRPLGGKVLTKKIEPDPNDPTWFILGMATDEATNFQGKHAPWVLIILDEATGIEPEIWEAAGLMAIGPNDRILAMGNPTDAGSRFFTECEIPGRWTRLTISGENHPNFIQRRVVIPGAITYERIQELEREYGRDHPVFQARVLGTWSRAMGRMFPQFESPVGRHVFDPEVVKIEHWHSWSIGADWGFAHNAAVLWGRFDGRKYYIVNELSRPGLDSSELSRWICEMTNPAGTEKAKRVKIDGLYLSHECFNYTDGPRSRADEMGDVLKKGGLPWPTKGNKERLDGLNIIRTMLNNDTLQISNTCPKLIAGIKRALRNPDRPEDMLKEDGDDEVDALRYLLATYPRTVITPLEVRIEDATKDFKEKGDYLAAMWTRAKLEEQARVDTRTVNLGKFVRRVWSRG